MELIVISIFFFINTFLVLLVNYYRRLFTQDKNTFERDEITDFKQILLSSWSRLFEKEPLPSYGGLAIGIFLGLLFSYMGGAYGRYYESYFFHSAVIPVLWYLGLPYIKEKISISMEENFIYRIVDKDITFFFGLSVVTVSSSFTAYGIYHAISFLWVFANGVGILGLLLFRIYREEMDARMIEESLTDFTRGDGNPPSGG